MTDESRTRVNHHSLVADCPECDGKLIEESRSWPDDRIHVGLICHDCDTSACVEWPQGSEPRQEDVSNGEAPNLRVKSVRWIDCPHCHGRGTVEEIGISTDRVGCPRCYRSGVVPRILESDGGRQTDEVKQCPECGRQISVGSDGVEYGHERGRGDTGQTERCSQRPDCVDPGRSGPDHDGWTLPGGEIA